MNNGTKDVTNSFFWYIGVVEDVKDPLKVGRLRVRIYNVHSPDKRQVPTESLPWASVIVPVSSGAFSGVGMSPTGVQVGTTVVGFFADSSEMQVPVVLGCLPGLTDGQESKNDVSQEARGRDFTKKSKVGPEPSPSYDAQYPFNRAMRTASGHVIEVDDTPGKERVHVFHKSGTYIEMRPDGTKIDKTNGKSYTISNGDDVIYINGSSTIQATGSISIKAGGGVHIEGDSVNITSKSNFIVNADDTIVLKDKSPDTERF